MSAAMSSSNDSDFIVNYLTFDNNFTIEISNVNNPQISSNNHSSLSSTCTRAVHLEQQNYEGIEYQINFIDEETASNLIDLQSGNVIENIIISDPHDIANMPIIDDSNTQHIINCYEPASSSSSIDGFAEDEGDSDCEELTNLNWLTELKNITNLAPSDQPVLTSDQPTQRFNKFINQVLKIRESYDKRCDVYRYSSSEKPPFNYAQIIAMAMLEEGQMTLQQICRWIQDKFAYYKEHKNWNNSIRHNLSLNFFFTKVARDKNEKGKGGYWKLAMDVSKSEKKRIRQRNRNNVSNRNRFLHSNKRFSKWIENRKDFSGDESKGNSMESNETLSDDMNNNSVISLEHVEIVEEQQNISNIIECEEITISSGSAVPAGPNVIVETIPTYNFSQIETLDDNELNRLIGLNDQDLIDDFLNYSENDGNETEFL